MWFVLFLFGFVRRLQPCLSFSRLQTPVRLKRFACQEGFSEAARDSRGLAIDSISACKSGHLGLPLGCAEIGSMLFGKHMRFHPKFPLWIDRDRFVLSAGHGSMFLYSWLHLSGYDISKEDLINFRKPHSRTPGHPEFSAKNKLSSDEILSKDAVDTKKRVLNLSEATTGPLGAGVGNSVGLAMALKMAATKYNREGLEIFSNSSRVIALCGDGCLQEGVSFEAISLAGHERLDNLILIYDCNEVTLDNSASFTQSENHALRFSSLGWSVLTIDGNRLDEIDNALEKARTNSNGKPTVIIAKTVIGKGIGEIEGNIVAHGEFGSRYQFEARKKLGLPEELWHVSEKTRMLFKEREVEQTKKYNEWYALFSHWKQKYPDLAQELENSLNGNILSENELFENIPAFNSSRNVATRESASEVLQHIARLLPNYVTGSADLFSSTKNYIKYGGNFGFPNHGFNKSYSGRNIHFGIREHGMGAILNGIAYFGLHLCSGSTFLVFADYMRAAIRVAALSDLPVSYIFTHDSVAVGEDGPTHQPVEGTSALRTIPNLDVIRPADPEEVVGAFVASVTRRNGPTAIILSRQNVQTLNDIPLETRRKGTLLGGYIAMHEQSALKCILLSSGSELQLVLQVAKQLSPEFGIRVVSIPCFERFDRQNNSYRDLVLPSTCTKRIAVEAGITSMWHKYTGLEEKVIGTDKFGFSAPGHFVLKSFGVDFENILQVVSNYVKN